MNKIEYCKSITFSYMNIILKLTKFCFEQNRLAKVGYVDYAKRPRKEWVLMHAAQLVVMISQVHSFLTLKKK